MFKRVARGNGYKEQVLIEEFKMKMNERMRRWLIEAESYLKSINQSIV